MSTDLVPLDQEAPPYWWARAAVRLAAAWLAAFAALCVVVGALCAVFWVKVVALPSYTVADDFSARTTERGLTEYFATDAWFSLIGFVVAIALGLVAWKWFSRLGWPVAVIAATGGLLAGVVCWLLGERLGPGPFDVRLAAANAGDVVAIQFLLRSRVALVVWAVAAVIPVLLWSALGPDSAEPPRAESRRRAWTRHRPRDAGEAAGSGEVVGHDIDPLAR